MCSSDLGVLACEELQRKILLDVQPLTDDSGQTFSVCVKISDNGCGIPQEHLEDIFEPFTTYKTGGTGLGLAIASRITRAHKGSLTVTSSPDDLTVFTLSLPV